MTLAFVNSEMILEGLVTMINLALVDLVICSSIVHQDYEVFEMKESIMTSHLRSEELVKVGERDFANTRLLVLNVNQMRYLTQTL